MIYVVTDNQELFKSDLYSIITAKEALDKVKDWKFIQFDTETKGVDPHIGVLLSMQLGSKDNDTQIVIDCTCTDIKIFKQVLESKRLIGHNLKFDLQWLYNYGIIPRKIYDTMIVEQLLYLGYPAGRVGFSLKDVTYRYLGVDMDKTIRGQIIWKGLTPDVINYAATDVKYLEDIMFAQYEECKRKTCVVASQVECNVVPAMAYLEWCGIKLDIDRWKAKMEKDKIKLQEAEKNLSDYAKNNPKLKTWVKVDPQGDLFTGFDLEPKWTVDWQKKEAIKVIQALGFNTEVKDKESGESKDSIMEKVLKTQKGIDDTFLKLYFNYQEHYKVCTSFGQGHLDSVNPITGRLHTSFKQLGAASGRMSCGTDAPNVDLARYKQIPQSRCKYVNLQQLPSDEETRSCFVAEKGNNFISCDYSALESRLGADIYQEKSMIDEFLHGSGDIHSLCAYMVYKKEIPRDTPIKDIKKLYPELRKAVKPIEFSQQFGGTEYAIQGAMGCTKEEALEFKKAYDEGFSGITKFKNQGSKFVRQNGYVLMNKYTGHKMYWWDWEHWKEVQDSYNTEFWDEFRLRHKGTGDIVEQQVRKHFKAASKWDRMALNGPTQGTGSTILKSAMTDLFNWVVDNGYFNKIKFCAFVHDEFDGEYPQELTEFPTIVANIMEKAAAKYCKSLPIPAEASVGNCWIH